MIEEFCAGIVVASFINKGIWFGAGGNLPCRYLLYVSGQCRRPVCAYKRNVYHSSKVHGVSKTFVPRKIAPQTFPLGGTLPPDILALSRLSCIVESYRNPKHDPKPNPGPNFSFMVWRQLSPHGGWTMRKYPGDYCEANVHLRPQNVVFAPSGPPASCPVTVTAKPIYVCADLQRTIVWHFGLVHCTRLLMSHQSPFCGYGLCRTCDKTLDSYGI